MRAATFKRWLYLLHRWAGIALCLVMALWFLSGMVMLYVGYPKLTPAEQMEGLPSLPAEGCCVPLAQALAAAGQPAASQWRLSSVAGQPRYVFSDGRKTAVAVDASSGQRIGAVGEAQALAAASHFAHGAPAQFMGSVLEDAWTHSRALDAHRPLLRVAVDDEQRRWLYVSGVTGEVVRDASFTERSWGWLGAWLHWLYIFRGGALNNAWTDIVIWLSVAGGVLGLSGLVVGVWRWRFRGRYKSGSRSPYRETMARWHHLLGLLGGTLALTWVLSGLFSMNPWKVFEAPGPRPDRTAFAGGRLSAEGAPEAAQVLAALQAQGQSARQLEWRRVDGEMRLLAYTSHGVLLLDARGQRLEPLSEAALRAAAERLLPGARVVHAEWLSTYDAYYYSREAHTMTGQRERPLPALRLELDDAQRHQVVLDPATGAIVQLNNSHQRVERWLFAFLHSFDLPVFLNTRPLWDGWMLSFSLAGLALSLSGVVMGWRRLSRRQ
ncbi:MAG: PepSY domain-containing protein [Roseateles asaccharophilus]|uniref:PepSY-associated transmembrane protein n=1 Tax=Roseateles asaccharophilus TaxID=582607 RepID=A0A4R6N385_9BURK|nr:PepSY domain-containing protein [Roseateles asaccharophilus]MDN3544213.1 PepSY domain-containing protein [Roseateles asaccharophilus]TDP09195.1 PepSY-associated transmembrane protein [Roseateles asaccharophilus]